VLYGFISVFFSLFSQSSNFSSTELSLLLLLYLAFRMVSICVFPSFILYLTVFFLVLNSSFDHCIAFQVLFCLLADFIIFFLLFLIFVSLNFQGSVCENFYGNQVLVFK
jgi:hypothetical protein